MSNYINEMNRLLSLFKSVNGRPPKDGDEFSSWCNHVELNSATKNSRGYVKS